MNRTTITNGRPLETLELTVAWPDRVEEVEHLLRNRMLPRDLDRVAKMDAYRFAQDIEGTWHLLYSGGCGTLVIW